MRRVWGEYGESMGKARERYGKGMGKAWERHDNCQKNRLTTKSYTFG